MKRSVYSLVLMDDVVQAIDALAYSMNTSRSNLINQILAQTVSYTTPEKRMKDIFDTVTRLFELEDAFQVQDQSSDAMLSIRSAIRFKYNPTIRYGVELYRTSDRTVGELKVAARTQSQRLKELLDDFFSGVIFLEQVYRERYFPEKNIRYQQKDGRFCRTIVLSEKDADLTSQQLGEAIARYIQMLDSAIKCYFEAVPNMEAASGQIQKKYTRYLESTDIFI